MHVGLIRVTALCNYLMIKAALFAALLATALCQGTSTCPAGCADCRSESGSLTCYVCYKSSFSAGGDCTGKQLTNCLHANKDGICTMCEAGFALDTEKNSCETKTMIDNCVLEYVGTPNKCVICSNGYPSDDQTSCKASSATSYCAWGTVLGKCSRCKYQNLMAAFTGECVGRYLYGCLQENGVGRCSGCDLANGFYMKFADSCWKD